MKTCEVYTIADPDWEHIPNEIGQPFRATSLEEAREEKKHAENFHNRNDLVILKETIGEVK